MASALCIALLLSLCCWTSWGAIVTFNNTMASMCSPPLGCDLATPSIWNNNIPPSDPTDTVIAAYEGPLSVLLYSGSPVRVALFNLTGINLNVKYPLFANLCLFEISEITIQHNLTCGCSSLFGDFVNVTVNEDAMLILEEKRMIIYGCTPVTFAETSNLTVLGNLFFPGWMETDLYGTASFPASCSIITSTYRGDYYYVYLNIYSNYVSIATSILYVMVDVEPGYSLTINGNVTTQVLTVSNGASLVINGDLYIGECLYILANGSLTVNGSLDTFSESSTFNNYGSVFVTGKHAYLYFAFVNSTGTIIINAANVDFLSEYDSYIFSLVVQGNTSVYIGTTLIDTISFEDSPISPSYVILSFGWQATTIRNDVIIPAGTIKLEDGSILLYGNLIVQECPTNQKYFYGGSLTIYGNTVCQGSFDLWPDFYLEIKGHIIAPALNIGIKSTLNCTQSTIITANLTNNGTLVVPNGLTLAGSYLQTINGTLEFPVLSDGSFPFVINGTAQLNGVVDVTKVQKPSAKTLSIPLIKVSTRDNSEFSNFVLPSVWMQATRFIKPEYSLTYRDEQDGFQGIYLTGHQNYKGLIIYSSVGGAVLLVLLLGTIGLVVRCVRRRRQGQYEPISS